MNPVFDQEIGIRFLLSMSVKNLFIKACQLCTYCLDFFLAVTGVMPCVLMKDAVSRITIQDDRNREIKLTK